MKKLILAATAIATLAGAALPAGAATIDRDGRGVTVIERHRAAPVVVTHHRLHRVVFFDRFHRRHIEWR